MCLHIVWHDVCNGIMASRDEKIIVLVRGDRNTRYTVEWSRVKKSCWLETSLVVKRLYIFFLLLRFSQWNAYNAHAVKLYTDST